jgi:hypothetical protein
VKKASFSEEQVPTRVVGQTLATSNLQLDHNASLRANRAQAHALSLQTRPRNLDSCDR